MWRRFALVVPLVLLTLALSDAPAAALCMVEPLAKLVKTSDVVWLGTVTEASAAPEGRSGIWKLTVRLDDVLKGPGSQGGIGSVFTYGCGPFITPSEARKEAPSFVGVQRLFMGGIDKQGALVAYSDVITPQGLSSEHQYDRALAVLGLTRGPADEPVAATPIQWLVIGVAILVVAA